MSTTRRRQNSSLSSSRALPHHTRQLSRQPIQPKSPHVADPFLQSFLAPSFDPAEYLNTSLPPLQSPATPRSHDGAVPLADLSTQAQSHLSQLNAHITRLTSTLTQLTDDILRSGSRLAYEVELLRGETLSLSEALSDGLHGDIVKFVPDGIREQTESKSSTQRRGSVATPQPAPANAEATAQPGNTSDPPYISQLQTLTLVRTRLDSVVKTFGDAMEFVFPPSELSVSSSFLSVSAPDPGAEAHSTEEKGQQVLKQFRDEISDLLTKSADPVEGIEKAAHRIEELKELTVVWKGTAEEKGRTKFIDSLAKMVEDRHKELMREMEQNGRRDARGGDAESGPSRRTANIPDTNANVESKPLSGYGIMSQLQRLRTGL
ncbi:hypothetical protein F4810DRAFT_656736 [Camillea tinctor]|nr:hypothetical protein F4810DRAFT_656736 [Camillea tinctor]